MRRLLVLAVVLLTLGSGVAQSGPELDALLDAFFAKDLKSLEPHLPPELAEVIAHMPVEAQQDLATRYLLAASLTRPGITITRPNGGAVVVMEQSRGDDRPLQRTEVYLDKYLSGGGETMLRFRLKSQTRHWNDEKITIWMKYVDGDWRIYEMDGYGREVHLDDPQYLEMLGRRRPTENEDNAAGMLRTINTAVVTYSSMFPDIGCPDSLEVLGPSTDSTERDSSEEDTTTEETYDSSPYHAGLIDSILSTPPFERSGYRFNYTRLSQSEYTVVARPLSYGAEAEYSYFTDQSGVIRYTSEDRDATVEDPPLE